MTDFFATMSRKMAGINLNDYQNAAVKATGNYRGNICPKLKHVKEIFDGLNGLKQLSGSFTDVLNQFSMIKDKKAGSSDFLEILLNHYCMFHMLLGQITHARMNERNERETISLSLNPEALYTIAKIIDDSPSFVFEAKGSLDSKTSPQAYCFHVAEAYSNYVKHRAKTLCLDRRPLVMIKIQELDLGEKPTFVYLLSEMKKISELLQKIDAFWSILALNNLYSFSESPFHEQIKEVVAMPRIMHICKLVLHDYLNLYQTFTVLYQELMLCHKEDAQQHSDMEEMIIDHKQKTDHQKETTNTIKRVASEISASVNHFPTYLCANEKLIELYKTQLDIWKKGGSLNTILLQEACGKAIAGEEITDFETNDTSVYNSKMEQSDISMIKHNFQSIMMETPGNPDEDDFCAPQRWDHAGGTPGERYSKPNIHQLTRGTGGFNPPKIERSRQEEEKEEEFQSYEQPEAAKPAPAQPLYDDNCEIDLLGSDLPPVKSEDSKPDVSQDSQSSEPTRQLSGQQNPVRQNSSGFQPSPLYNVQQPNQFASVQGFSTQPSYPSQQQMDNSFQNWMGNLDPDFQKRQQQQQPMQIPMNQMGQGYPGMNQGFAAMNQGYPMNQPGAFPAGFQTHQLGVAQQQQPMMRGQQQPFMTNPNNQFVQHQPNPNQRVSFNQPVNPNLMTQEQKILYQYQNDTAQNNQFNMQ